jgi:hypothetical protein
MPWNLSGEIEPDSRGTPPAMTIWVDMERVSAVSISHLSP